MDHMYLGFRNQMYIDSQARGDATPVGGVQAQEVTVTDLSVGLVGVDRLLTDDEIDVFEQTTASWFEDYYNTRRRRRRGLQATSTNGDSDGIYDMKTEITVTDQALSTDANGASVNTVTYDQKMTYVATEAALADADNDPSSYAYQPFTDATAQNTFGTNLKSSDAAAFGTLQAIDAPEDPAATSDNGGDSGGGQPSDNGGSTDNGGNNLDGKLGDADSGNTSGAVPMFGFRNMFTTIAAAAVGVVWFLF